MKKNRISANGLANVKGKKVEVAFNGGDVTSDAGALLLRQADLKLGLTKSLADLIDDSRAQCQVEHSQLKMIRQRIFGIGLGYEDVNDQASLRYEPGFQTAIGEMEPLASAPTICRFENSATKDWIWSAHQVMFNTFVSSFSSPPDELILDFDATDDKIHGLQEGRFFHGYYDNYCFLPLYVFCGSHLLAAYLRPSNIDGAKHSWGILSILVKKLRAVWPEVKIIFRADSGFSRYRLFEWCDKNDVYFIIGQAKNSKLREKLSDLSEEAERAFESTGEKQRCFTTFKYQAKSWRYEQRVIGKAEHSSLGSNPRFVITNLPGESSQLYDGLYCQRGDMENRIKEQQLYLFSDRTSCHGWMANQFRVILSAFAYILLDTIRRLALQKTSLARAQCSTIRLKLFKIGAVIIRNTRRIKFMLSEGYPHKKLFMTALKALC